MQLTITKPLRAVQRMMQMQVPFAPSSSGSGGSRRGLMTTTTTLGGAMSRPQLISGIGHVRTFVKVGDKVPVNFIKGNRHNRPRSTGCNTIVRPPICVILTCSFL